MVSRVLSRTHRLKRLLALTRSLYEFEAWWSYWTYSEHGDEAAWEELLPIFRRHSVIVAASRLSPLVPTSIALALMLMAAGQALFVALFLSAGVLATVPAVAIAFLGAIVVFSIGALFFFFGARSSWPRLAIGMIVFIVAGWLGSLSGSVLLVGSLVIALATHELGILVVRATREWWIPRTLAARGRVLALGEFVAVGVSILLNLLRQERVQSLRPNVQRFLALEFQWTARQIVRSAPALARWSGADISRSRRRAAGVASLLAGFQERLSEVRDAAEYEAICAGLATLAVDAGRGDWGAAENAPERPPIRRRWFTWRMAARLISYLVVAALLPLLGGSVPREIIFGSQVTLLVAALATIPLSDSAAAHPGTSGAPGKPGPDQGQRDDAAQERFAAAAGSRRRRGRRPK